jgi:hypothetical protein
VPSRRSARLLTGLIVAALALIAGVVGSGASPQADVVRTAAAAPAPIALPDTIAFPVRYDGLGAEGVDLVWRGVVRGPVPAQVTIRVEYAGPPEDHGMPVWPVNAWLFFATDSLRGSFAAELSGSLDWRAGQMRVTGLVSDGARRGWPVEQRMRVRRPELSGEAQVTFLSPLASAAR